LRARGRLYRHVNFGDPHFFLFQFHPRPSENESEIESEKIWTAIATSQSNHRRQWKKEVCAFRSSIDTPTARGNK
jgi:hypothetical protein